MNYYNPFMQQQQMPQIQINPQQFASVVSTLNNDAISRLVNLAKMQGISEKDIQSGLSIIQSFQH